MRNTLIGIFLALGLFNLPTTCFAHDDTEILVCSEDRVTCIPKTCLEQCLKESDEPLDCPQVCTLEA